MVFSAQNSYLVSCIAFYSGVLRPLAKTYRASYTSGHFIWNLWNEPSASVRFCLWYDRFKLDFIVFKVDIISIENATLSRTSLWRYMYAPKCYVTCGHTIFMTWRYPQYGYSCRRLKGSRGHDATGRNGFPAEVYSSTAHISKTFGCVSEHHASHTTIWTLDANVANVPFRSTMPLFLLWQQRTNGPVTLTWHLVQSKLYFNCGNVAQTLKYCSYIISAYFRSSLKYQKHDQIQ